jgi:hypothetical protein
MKKCSPISKKKWLQLATNKLRQGWSLFRWWVGTFYTGGDNPITKFPHRVILFSDANPSNNLAINPEAKASEHTESQGSLFDT